MFHKHYLLSAPNADLHNNYAIHFPERLYSYLERLGLIEKKQLNLRSVCETITLEIKEESLDNQHDAVSLSVKETSNDVGSSTLKQFIFIKKNAYRVDFHDESGRNYIGTHNRLALMWSDNMLCQDKTSMYVDNIINTINRVHPDFTEEFMAVCGCTVM